MVASEGKPSRALNLGSGQGTWAKAWSERPNSITSIPKPIYASSWNALPTMRSTELTSSCHGSLLISFLRTHNLTGQRQDGPGASLTLDKLRADLVKQIAAGKKAVQQFSSPAPNSRS